MTTVEERREVARRLRELDYSDLQESLICAYLDALGIKGYEDWIGIAHRLADLIEPGEPEVKCVAEVKLDGERLEKLAYDAAVELTGIDRDALLEEAKELEKCARYFGLDFDEDEPLRDRLKEASEDFAGCAAHIREALGLGERDAQ